MFRNQYDHDVTVWSPQGRIHQIEYAMEAVKQGSATVGLKNTDYAILVALKRAPSELSSYQEKITKIDDHVGCSIAGLTADGRSLTSFLRKECLDCKWSTEEPLPISRMIASMAHKMQIPTQKYGSRPFGVGIIIGGYDGNGPHIYYQCPSANYYDCKAMAIGSRSQSARTYLEKHLEEFKNCSLEELIRHGLQALNDTLPNDMQLNDKNCTVAIVGKDKEFAVADDGDLAEYLKGIKIQKGREDAAAVAVAEPMAVDSEAVAAPEEPQFPAAVDSGAVVESMEDQDQQPGV